MSKLLTIGVKYCGGCNVQFDRTALVDYIRRYFGEQIKIVYTSNSSDYDLLLVMNACLVACASTEGLEPKLDTYIVCNFNEAKPGEQNPVVQWIQKHLDA